VDNFQKTKIFGVNSKPLFFGRAPLLDHQQTIENIGIFDCATCTTFSNSKEKNKCSQISVSDHVTDQRWKATGLYLPIMVWGLHRWKRGARRWGAVFVVAEALLRARASQYMLNPTFCYK
jgi:hypothetical protein